METVSTLGRLPLRILLESKSIIDESDLIDSLQLLFAVVPIGQWASLESDEGFLLAAGKQIFFINLFSRHLVFKFKENIWLSSVIVIYIIL